MADDELARHLTTIRSQIENVTIDLARREELALEMAATLDRAAQSSPTRTSAGAAGRKPSSCSTGSSRRTPTRRASGKLRFQAAVFRWAQGRSWTETGLLDPR